jgi:hypothetical protein
MDAPFRRFYEELLVMIGDAPLPMLLAKIAGGCPEPESQRVLLGHLEDSLADLLRRGRETDPRAAGLEALIAELKQRPDDPSGETSAA